MSKAGINFKKPTLFIKHAELERVSEDSAFKSICPACDSGWLLVSREGEPPYRLRKKDMCTLCAQKVYYTDLDEIFPQKE